MQSVFKPYKNHYTTKVIDVFFPHSSHQTPNHNNWRLFLNRRKSHPASVLWSRVFLVPDMKQETISIYHRLASSRWRLLPPHLQMVSTQCFHKGCRLHVCNMMWNFITGLLFHHTLSILLVSLINKFICKSNLLSWVQFYLDLNLIEFFKKEKNHW